MVRRAWTDCRRSRPSRRGIGLVRKLVVVKVMSSAEAGVRLAAKSTSARDCGGARRARLAVTGLAITGLGGHETVVIDAELIHHGEIAFPLSQRVPRRSRRSASMSRSRSCASLVELAIIRT